MYIIFYLALQLQHCDILRYILCVFASYKFKFVLKLWILDSYKIFKIVFLDVVIIFY
jgi:hypothetical protein